MKAPKRKAALYADQQALERLALAIGRKQAHNVP
jgi:hypothetical protein